ncbi:MAG: fibronectin type III domain-containing protein [Paludibacter sp.]|nr:fibronectin type III domain-containing protein [Paludibacter sp.]
MQTISDGDRNIILSTGYDVNKKWSKVGPLSKPTNFKLKQGSNKGSIYLVCDPIAGASIYEVEYTEGIPTPNSLWMKQTSTRRKITIDGLISGKQYTFRMAGGGSHPSRIWSEVISSYVL